MLKEVMKKIEKLVDLQESQWKFGSVRFGQVKLATRLMMEKMLV